jgi:hypothetical protein
MIYEYARPPEPLAKVSEMADSPRDKEPLYPLLFKKGPHDENLGLNFDFLDVLPLQIE